MEQIEASCGGDPTADEGARAECEHRSPSGHVEGARDAGLPVYIDHGLDDPNVPPDHGVRAFQRLAGEDDRLEAEVVEAVAGGRLPGRLHGSVEAETYFGDDDPEVIFARESGPVTLVRFEGEHDMVYHPGPEWMTGIAAGR